MEILAIPVALFALLVLLALRNGAFRRRGSGDRDGSGVYPQVQGGAVSGESIRDPRVKLDAGDRLGRR